MQELSGEENNSFGVKKIIDCRIGEHGMQMYKVKWEATWEPAENLASCQHLIDDFWSFVNKARNNQEMQQQQTKKMRLDATNRQGTLDETAHRLTEDSKADIHNLIARTSSTSAHCQILRSPSELLSTSAPPIWSHTKNSSMLQDDQSHFSKKMVATHQNSIPKGTLTKAEFDGPAKLPPKTSDLSKDNLKYLENFSNPYVKIILVCIKCNKELSMKFQSTWKRHYLTHVDDADKPFKCKECGKAFVQSTQLTSHMKKHARDDKQRVERAMGMNPPTLVKTEYSYTYTQ